jgi:hypothetical protein
MDRSSKELTKSKTKKKMGFGRLNKPTRMGKIEERPLMTRGMIERRKEMEKRNSRALPPAMGMLTGGQAKIAAKAPPFNKIDGKDFAVLRKEKAKGRGKGLQDEKMKPGKVMKADKGKMIKKDPTAPIKNVGVKDRYGMPMKVGKQLGSRAAEAAKATRIGKIAAGVAGAALAAKAGLEKLYEKRTGKKPFTKREKKRTLVDKKMGGGMMMRKPMGGG